MSFSPPEITSSLFSKWAFGWVSGIPGVGILSDPGGVVAAVLMIDQRLSTPFVLHTFSGATVFLQT